MTGCWGSIARGTLTASKSSTQAKNNVNLPSLCDNTAGSAAGDDRHNVEHVHLLSIHLLAVEDMHSNVQYLLFAVQRLRIMRMERAVSCLMRFSFRWVLIPRFGGSHLVDMDA